MTGSVDLWVIDVVVRRRCGQREIYGSADVHYPVVPEGGRIAHHAIAVATN